MKESLQNHRSCPVWIMAVCWVFAAEVWADEPVKTIEPQKPDIAASDGKAGPHRSIYLARNASVSVLASLLENHFGGEDGTKFVAEPNANLLSVRTGSAATLEEVLKVLAQIDRPQRQVAVHVLLVEFPSPKEKPAAGELPMLPVDVGDLNGSLWEVRRQLSLWAREGHVTSVRRFELKVLENQQTQLSLGEMKPIPRGFTSNGVIATPSLSVHDFGTMISAVVQIKEAEKIEIALKFEEAQLSQLERGVEIAKGVNGPIVSPAISNKRFSSTLSVANGRSTATTCFEPGAQSGAAPMAIVVSARVIDPNEAPGAGSEASSPTVDAPRRPDQPARSSSNQLETNPPTSGPSFSRPGRLQTSPNSLAAALRDEEFAKRMNLSDEQKKKLNQLRTELFNSFREPNNRDEFPNAVKQFEEKCVELLTDEQKRLWQLRLDELKKGTGPK